MELALRKTYDALCEPKLLIVVGSCAISGGPYVGSPEANDGVIGLPPEAGLPPPDLFVPGCPPPSLDDPGRPA